MSKTAVYYNSACPVCAAGIAYQKKVLKAGASSLEWIDVHSDNEAVENLDADLAFVRERLHVTDAEGKKHVGADAFTALWALSPRQRWLSQIGRLPVFNILFRWIYNVSRPAFIAGTAQKGDGRRNLIEGRPHPPPPAVSIHSDLFFISLPAGVFEERGCGCHPRA